MEHGNAGWFVVNAREAQWRGGNGRSPICSFEGEDRFPELGINLSVLEPGQLGALYHAEGAQEDFLVLSGTCLLLIEGGERQLREWDFVHCPPDVPHTLVAIDEPCLVLQVGARPARSLVYLVSELARRYGAGVWQETSSVEEAYGTRRREPVAYDGWLGSKYDSVVSPSRISLDHCVIAVSDWVQSNAFYERVLGAAIDQNDEQFGHYRFGNWQLNVHGPNFVGLNARKPVEPGNSDLCFIWPGPIEEAVEHLRRNGVDIEAGPFEGESGTAGRGRHVYFRDPDGSLLEFVSYE